MSELLLWLGIGGGIGGLGLSTWFVMSRLRRASGANGVTKLESEKVAANPTSLKVGHTVYLDEINETFTVQATTRYQVKGEPEDFWYEFEIFDSIGNRTLYLSCERDEEDRWSWSTHRKIKYGDIESLLDEKGKPLRTLTIENREWRVAPDCFHYTTESTSTRTDRPESITETVRITDYVPTDGSDHELSIEVWKGGLCLTIGQPCRNKILILK